MTVFRPVCEKVCIFDLGSALFQLGGVYKVDQRPIYNDSVFHALLKVGGCSGFLYKLCKKIGFTASDRG